MIEKLEQLTIGQFIDLVSGDTSVLGSKREILSPLKVAITMRNIVFEYKEIADNAGAKSYLARAEELIKARIGVIVFSMCKNLVTHKAYANAREVLKEYGIDTRKMNDERVSVEIDSRLARAKNAIERFESEADTSETSNIRRLFDEQTAALMAYFKFQIDTESMKAPIYAHLVARYNREIKAQIAAMKK